MTLAAEPESLETLCERGQRELISTQYLQAESTLQHAAALALTIRDFDTLARVCMPLQEARRQKRQRCGEGIVCLELISKSENDTIDPHRTIENFPHGQLLVGGWGTIEPAIQIRKLASEKNLFLETFLAAAYPIGAGIAIAIVPSIDVRLPAAVSRSVDELIRLLPPHAVVLDVNQLPRGATSGSAESFARVSSMWEQLHAPFLALADATRDPMQRIYEYQKTIRVDYACELAHQRLSNTAREIARNSISQ